MSKSLPPVALTIFGITGDLSKRKLLPALYHLVDYDLLPEQCVIVGVFRSSPDVPALLATAAEHLRSEGVEPNKSTLDKLASFIRPIQMDSTKAEDQKRLGKLLEGLDEEFSHKLKRLFYLAIPPNIFGHVLEALDEAGLSQDSRILVEKPFGHDLPSARKLIDSMNQYFDEEQIYRIDHYLAKETAQNIMAFRFNNPLIEGLWSRQFIDYIQITVAESIGVEGRANFYENMGALRDIVQSHLLQLLLLTTIEAPATNSAKAIHEEKLTLLKSIKPISPKHIDEEAVRGQYAGYRDEVGNPNSLTETYAALKLEIANSRWGGVPMLLRTGKSLAERKTEIVVVFKDRSRREVPANVLTIRIQPNEGISIQLLAKQPGFAEKLEPVTMDFCYNTAFNGHHPDAYQRVLVDAMRGDQTLFASSDEVLASWELLQPLLEEWNSHTEGLEKYTPGSWGPASAEALAEGYGCSWLQNQPHACSQHIPKQAK